MGSEDLLVMAMALPPMWFAARLWWSARHAVDELRESCRLALGPRRDGHDGGFDAAPLAKTLDSAFERAGDRI